MADDKPPLPVGVPIVPPPLPGEAITPAPPPIAGAPPPGAIAATPMNLPPIPMQTPPPATRASLPIAAGAKKDAEVKDTFRELIETIVFVVVLVLMLKTFLAEAFVIPTGSMADTLLGYHYKVTCQQCGKVNWINATHVAEPPPGVKQPRISRCKCSNCDFINELNNPEPVRGGPPQ